MRLEQIAAVTINHYFGALLRRALVAAAATLFAITAIYQLTVAGAAALELQYGPVYAHLIVGIVYAVLALTTFAVLWATRAKPAETDAAALGRAREVQIIMLVEAAMLGYALAQKSGRAD